jgi:hypothetical protein
MEKSIQNSLHDRSVLKVTFTFSLFALRGLIKSSGKTDVCLSLERFNPIHNVLSNRREVTHRRENFIHL